MMSATLNNLYYVKGYLVSDPTVDKSVREALDKAIATIESPIVKDIGSGLEFDAEQFARQLAANATSHTDYPNYKLIADDAPEQDPQPVFHGNVGIDPIKEEKPLYGRNTSHWTPEKREKHAQRMRDHHAKKREEKRQKLLASKIEPKQQFNKISIPKPPIKTTPEVPAEPIEHAHRRMDGKIHDDNWPDIKTMLRQGNNMLAIAKTYHVPTQEMKEFVDRKRSENVNKRGNI